MLRKTFRELRNYLVSVEKELNKPAPIVVFGNGSVRRAYFCYRELDLVFYPRTGAMIDRKSRDQHIDRRLGQDLNLLDNNVVDLGKKLYLAITDCSNDYSNMSSGVNAVNTVKSDSSDWIKYLNSLPEKMLDQEIILVNEMSLLYGNGPVFVNGRIGKCALYMDFYTGYQRIPASTTSTGQASETKSGESILICYQGPKGYCKDNFIFA